MHLEGQSPRNIQTSTIGDEIALHFGPQAKVFGVSVKDRGAIAFAGHTGDAYWFSKAEGRFVTSTFYRQDYPGWVDAWQEKGIVSSYANTDWKLLLDPSMYLFFDADDQEWETDFPGWGRTFPHNYGPADNKYYTTLLTLSPAGDEITVDFAKTLMNNEGIGLDDVTDFLSVSLSSTDYVGHIFGPSSLEAEDNLKRLDRSLADLFSHVDETVGLNNTLIVLSADHGAPEAPGYLETLGIEAQHFSFEDLNTKPGFARLEKQFGLGSELIDSFTNPYVYLNRTAIDAAGLRIKEVETAVAAELLKLSGIAYAVGSNALRQGAVPNTHISRAVMANFHPDRSGDIYVVFEPHWFVADFDGLSVASAHGSLWSYDSHVPVIVSGPGVPAGRITRRVETVDVAPTIAAYLGTKQPSGVAGIPLAEVLSK